MPPKRIYVERDAFTQTRQSMYLKEIRNTYPEKFNLIESAREILATVVKPFPEMIVIFAALKGSEAPRNQAQSKLEGSLTQLEDALRVWYGELKLPVDDCQWALLALGLRPVEILTQSSMYDSPRISQHVFTSWNPSNQTEAEFRLQTEAHLNSYIASMKLYIGEKTGVWLGSDLTLHLNWFARRCICLESAETIGRSYATDALADGISKQGVQEALDKCAQLLGVKMSPLRPGRKKNIQAG